MANKRKSPVASVAPDLEQDPHQEKLSEMHGALYDLGDAARPPRKNSKLVPKSLTPSSPDIAKAKKHINKLHKMFKSLKKGKE